jgi:hypothetical protein
VRDKLSGKDRENILKQLARFTGLDASVIDPRTLIVGRQQFAEQLLKKEKQVLARYDTRQTTIDSCASNESFSPEVCLNVYVQTPRIFCGTRTAATTGA